MVNTKPTKLYNYVIKFHDILSFVTHIEVLQANQ